MLIRSSLSNRTSAICFQYVIRFEKKLLSNNIQANRHCQDGVSQSSFNAFFGFSIKQCHSTCHLFGTVSFSRLFQVCQSNRHYQDGVPQLVSITFSSFSIKQFHSACKPFGTVCLSNCDQLCYWF